MLEISLTFILLIPSTLKIGGIFSFMILPIILSISLTLILFIPSILKTFLLQPIVGISTNTPRWHARPKPLTCNIPFPSTKITCGIYSGLVSFKSLIKSTKWFTSLKAKNPGI